MNVYKKAEDDKRILSIVYDDFDAEDPREWSNLSKMVCWHNRYSLGDNHDFNDTEDMLRREVLLEYDYDELVAYGMDTIEYNEESDTYLAESLNYGAIEADYEDVEYEINADPLDFLTEENLWNLFYAKFEYLPLYLYDHSGITMNTSGFSCRWDGGQVGWIYAPKDNPIIADDDLEDVLTSEVEIYDSYLRGDVYGFMAEEKILGGTKIIDSCSGFIGDEWELAVKEQLPKEFEHLIEELEYAQ